MDICSLAPCSQPGVAQLCGQSYLVRGHDPIASLLPLPSSGFVLRLRHIVVGGGSHGNRDQSRARTGVLDTLGRVADAHKKRSLRTTPRRRLHNSRPFVLSQDMPGLSVGGWVHRRTVRVRRDNLRGACRTSGADRAPARKSAELAQGHQTRWFPPAPKCRRSMSRSGARSTFVRSGREKSDTVQSNAMRMRVSHRGIWNR